MILVTTKSAAKGQTNISVKHQTVISQEAVAQMEMADAEPDMVIGCFGGGSNFAGIGFPFLRKNFTEGKKTRSTSGTTRCSWLRSPTRSR